MHARPGASRPYQSWYHTMHLLSHAEASAAPLSRQCSPAGSLWLCYCSRRFKAARKQNRPPRLEKLLFGKRRRRLHVDRRGNGWWGAVVIKTTIIPKLRRCCWCKKNKPAEAPGSGDSASRLSCTGKSATKAGRFPLLGISGTLVPASVGM